MDRIKDLIKKLLHIKDTPERTALAYSVGIFLGFSPFLGLHTLGGVVVAFLFGLEPGCRPSGSLVQYPLVGRSLLCARHMGRAVDHRISDRRRGIAGDLSDGNGERVSGFRFFGLPHIPVGFSSLLHDRVDGFGYFFKFSPLSSLSQVD